MPGNTAGRYSALREDERSVHESRMWLAAVGEVMLVGMPAVVVVVMRLC